MVIRVLVASDVTVRIWLVVLLVIRSASVELVWPVVVLGGHVAVVVVLVLRVTVSSLDCVLVVELF